jgi:DNA-binding winged helix-turn-helix (wHTH) protein
MIRIDVSMRVRFDRFTLDTDQRRLIGAGVEIPMAPKTFNLLALLIQERPKALAKDDILARLWPGTFVTENNLATLISDLRTALTDDARAPRFIRTVYAYGYAFVAAVTEDSDRDAATAVSHWRLIHEQREIVLRPGMNILGRSGDGVIVLDSPTISRRHAAVSVAGDCLTVEDLGSKNGTWVGATPVKGPASVKNGDELRLGSVVVIARFSPAAPTTQTVVHTRS